MSKRIREREYNLIGWILMQIQPQTAKEIICTYMRPKPKYNDLLLVPHFLHQFCKIINIEPDKVHGSLFKTSMVDKRNLFVSAMIRLYNPELYRHPSDRIIIRRGFNKTLADALGIDQGRISKAIRDSIIQEKYMKTSETR